MFVRASKRLPVLLFCFTILSAETKNLKITYAICSSDANPLYLQFWPLFAESWKKVVGIEPVLAFIANKNVHVDETIGTVIRLSPIPGVPSGRYAQMVRLLLPLYFPHEGCIVSDIDMIPLSRGFYLDSVANIAEDCFVLYDRGYPKGSARIPMCYVAGTGTTFGSVFHINSPKDIPQTIKRWYQGTQEVSADEQILYHAVKTWKHYNTRCKKLDLRQRRVNRAHWGYDPEKVKSGFYYDAHLPRPMCKSCQRIKNLTQLLGLSEPNISRYKKNKR